MPVAPLDTLIAHKVISLSELSGTEKRVAAALIESFNRKTGQCDPSLGRVAGLIGVHRRTVIRAMPRLEQAGMFRKDRHGGRSHRNSYQPIWSFFAKANAAWKTHFYDKTSRARSKMSPCQGQDSHLAGDQAVTQTYLSKPTQKTDLPKSDSKSNLPTKRTSEQKKEKDRNRASGKSAIAMPRMFPVKHVPPRDAAYASAERRMSKALTDRFAEDEKAHARIIEAVDAEIYATAIEAEMRTPGAGLTYLLEQFQKSNWLQETARTETSS